MIVLSLHFNSQNKNTKVFVFFKIFTFPNISSPIFDAPINILIGPIRSSYGWHIVEKLDERNQIFIDSVEYKLKKQSIVENIIKKKIKNFES